MANKPLSPLPHATRSSHFLERIFHPWRQSTVQKRPGTARDAQHVITLCHALLSERGEVSGARLAVQVLNAYQSLDTAALEIFFDRLVEEFSPDPSRVERAAATYAADPSQVNLVSLQRAVEPPRQELFRRFNMAPGAIAVLCPGHALFPVKPYNTYGCGPLTGFGIPPW